MRIVVDLQGAQTIGSRRRGIGRYSLALALAMARQAGKHELFLALNHAFPETIEPIRERFRNLVPPERLLVWRTPGPVAWADRASRRGTLAGELVREHALFGLRPDIVHVSSLFEGFSDDAVTSIGPFGVGMPTAVTLYQLIPCLHPDPHFPDASLKEWYLSKLASLRGADLLLTISDYSRAEAVEALGLAKDRIAVVTPDADPQFQRVTLGPEAELILRQRHGLDRKFLMYTGGIDHRKNVEGLIEAFARLPHSVRAGRQLAIVCQANEHDWAGIARLCQRLGLERGEVVLTGFVDDHDLVCLYNICDLFVFPSLYEGFGLPILEAMRCGAPVVGSDRTGIPEAIGWRNALFDPTSIESIAGKLVEALTDDGFRQSLRCHGALQARKFCWDSSARRAFEAFEALHDDRQRTVRGRLTAAERPRLAYLSPLPPEPSGIADYSAELLAYLTRHYRIELITDLPELGDPYLDANFPRRRIADFETHAEEYDRILYHFGNSRFHQHMFGLISRFPGTVVLHDFYLSGVLHWLEATTPKSKDFRHSLYRSHGYRALRTLKADGAEAAVRAYPCNWDILENAQGVIVHSAHARALADRYYGRNCATDWALIPHLRRLQTASDRNRARRALGLPEDAFVVCSFGIVDKVKLNHRLLSAWLQSPLAEREDCRLLFVGDLWDPEYAKTLGRAIETSTCRGRIALTFRVSREDYRLYLQAADTAVQLRAASQGETSGALLDCLAHGLPTVVNAAGSITEVPDDAVIKLPEEFGDNDLAGALMRLAANPALRRTLGGHARAYISKAHNPVMVAGAFADAVERFASTHPRAARRRLVCDLASAIGEDGRRPAALVELALAIAENERRPRPKQLFVDVSVIARNDLRMGVQHATRSILRVLLENPPAEYRVEPVYSPENGNHYRYARAFTQGALDLEDVGLEDAPLDIYPGDVFLGLDVNPDVSAEAVAYLGVHVRRGLRAYFIVHDLLPIWYPQWFPAGLVQGFREWLAGVARFAQGFVCVSRTVADELATWLIESGMMRRLDLGYFHLGAEIAEDRPSDGLSEGVAALLARLDGREALLMVGTVAPGKGHAQVLDAMDILWAAGEDISLVIVGEARSWMTEGLVTRLRAHPERGKRLFWFEGASDEVLERLYKDASGLLMASEGDGFGVPILEAARHGLPIIARDLPIFRELASDHAVYFDGAGGQRLAAALTAWLAAYRQGDVPDVSGIPRLNWMESTQQMLCGILKGKWYRTTNS